MELFRGDTFGRNIVFKNYKLQNSDVIKVGIKKRLSDTEYVLPLKELTNGTTQFIFTPEETKNLIPDTYILEIELTYDGEVSTLDQYVLVVKEDLIHD